MQKYKQYCPVARASEILADRWTPLIVRELILGSHRFNEIERGLPGISRSLLASMAYHLSEAGKDLKTVIETPGAWGVRWAFGEPRPEELDAGLLIWRIHQRINRELLPERRTVVEFDFTGPRGRRVWLLLEPRDGVAAGWRALAPAGAGFTCGHASRCSAADDRPNGASHALTSFPAAEPRHRVPIDVLGDRLAEVVADLDSAWIVHAAPDSRLVPIRTCLRDAGIRTARLPVRRQRERLPVAEVGEENGRSRAVLARMPRRVFRVRRCGDEREPARIGNRRGITVGVRERN